MGCKKFLHFSPCQSPVLRVTWDRFDVDFSRRVAVLRTAARPVVEGTSNDGTKTTATAPAGAGPAGAGRRHVRRTVEGERGADRPRRENPPPRGRRARLARRPLQAPAHAPRIVA